MKVLPPCSEAGRILVVWSSVCSGFWDASALGRSEYNQDQPLWSLDVPGKLGFMIRKQLSDGVSFSATSLVSAVFNEAAQDPSQLSSTFVIGIFTFRQGPAVQLEYLPAMKRGNGKSPILR